MKECLLEPVARYYGPIRLECPRLSSVEIISALMFPLSHSRELFYLPADSAPLAVIVMPALHI